jgi:metal-responsive CopG/Arc/MetJ family transcriptional regulator
MAQPKRRLTIYLDSELVKRLQHIVVDRQDGVKSLSQLIEEMCQYALREENENSVRSLTQ